MFICYLFVNLIDENFWETSVFLFSERVVGSCEQDNWITFSRILQNPLWKNLLLQKTMHTWTVNLNSKKEILIQKNSLFSKMEWFGAMSSNLQARGNLVFILYFPIWILLLSEVEQNYLRIAIRSQIKHGWETFYFTWIFCLRKSCLIKLYFTVVNTWNIETNQNIVFRKLIF